jgi:predicted transposase YbfD/YdcC
MLGFQRLRCRRDYDQRLITRCCWLSRESQTRDVSGSQAADFLLSVKGNEKTLHRQIRWQFEGKRQIPFSATGLALFRRPQVAP